jgi:pimeloyl-ACP methyl ester carboxylesterase
MEGLGLGETTGSAGITAVHVAVIVGRLEVIDEAGHFPWLDRPRRLWPVVTSFVNGGVA